jgi:hypothetical protein
VRQQASGNGRRGPSAKDLAAQARIARDLRYWTSRYSTAQVVHAPKDAAVVRFGSKETIARDDDRRESYHIVGEDEAGPSRGPLPPRQYWRPHRASSVTMWRLIYFAESSIKYGLCGLRLAKLEDGHGMKKPTKSPRQRKLPELRTLELFIGEKSEWAIVSAEPQRPLTEAEAEKIVQQLIGGQYEDELPHSGIKVPGQ